MLRLHFYISLRLDRCGAVLVRSSLAQAMGGWVVVWVGSSNSAKKGDK